MSLLYAEESLFFVTLGKIPLILIQRFQSSRLKIFNFIITVSLGHMTSWEGESMPFCTVLPKLIFLKWSLVIKSRFDFVDDAPET